MDSRPRNIAEQAAKFGVFTDLYSQGATPDQVKRLVVETLGPYAENEQSLERHAVDLLVADAVSLRAISVSPYAMGLFREALRIHRAGLHASQCESLVALAASNEDIAAGLATFWSAYHTQRGVDSLELEEFAHECLRTIGTIIEGPMKAHLLVLACHSTVARGKPQTIGELRRLTLGHLVDELTQHSKVPEVFAVRGVKLNQWRNIAQHFTSRIEGQQIVCEYGERHSEIRLRRAELAGVCKDVLSAFKALKVAHVLVFFDHLDEMRQGGLLKPTSMRPEATLVVLISALASQGFEVVDTHFSSNESRIVVRDLSTLDPQQRRLHSTQFVIPLFRERPADTVTVEYQERDGTASLRTTATRDVLEEADRTGNWNLVAEKCLFTNLKGST